MILRAMASFCKEIKAGVVGEIQTKETEKVKIAKYLTFKTDQSISLEKNLLWVNIVLIGILVLNLIGVKKYGS